MLCLIVDRCISLLFIHLSTSSVLFSVLTTSSGLSANFALRDYGDFDRCLDIIADDDERRPSEQFFTGQYCMMQMELPLPALNRNISYMDKVLHFNETELGGTVSELCALPWASLLLIFIRIKKPNHQYWA